MDGSTPIANTETINRVREQRRKWDGCKNPELKSMQLNGCSISRTKQMCNTKTVSAIKRVDEDVGGEK